MLVAAAAGCCSQESTDCEPWAEQASTSVLAVVEQESVVGPELVAVAEVALVVDAVPKRFAAVIAVAAEQPALESAGGE